MYDDNKTVENSIESVERAEWKRPEIRRMMAGEAEVAFTSGSDGATFAS
jgi:hypothetical protein